MQPPEYGPPAPQYGHYPPPGPYPPQPPHGPPPFPPPGAYPQPGPVPPRKNRAPLVVGLVLGLVVLPLLLCCGGGYYFAEWVPQQEFKARQALYEKIGVPDGFTRDLVDDDEDSGNTLDTAFYLDCPNGVCPADPTTSIHKWMADSGAINLTATDVAECIRTIAEMRAVNCDPLLRWERDGHAINLFPFGMTMGKTVKDKRFKLGVSISTID